MMAIANITIYNTTFTSNKGTTGGGLQLLCSITQPCLTTLNNVTFTKNDASKQGGGIYYDLYRPNMTNVAFVNVRIV